MRKGEYYLPDLVAIYRRRRRVVTTFSVADPQLRFVESTVEQNLLR